MCGISGIVDFNKNNSFFIFLILIFLNEKYILYELRNDCNSNIDITIKCFFVVILLDIIF